MKISLLSTIFIIFSLGGFYASFREKRRIDLLAELDRLLCYMENEITNYRKELEDIFMSFESPFLDRVGFSERLGAEGFSGAVKWIRLDPSSKNALLEFGGTLGMLSCEEQKASILKCRATLEKIITDARAEYPQKRKLYISFGVMIGALIFIIGI